MMQVTKGEALQEVNARSTEYVLAQQAQDEAHARLKAAIKQAKRSGGATQQEIADATLVHANDFEAFGLSRQRISQIINEE